MKIAQLQNVTYNYIFDLKDRLLETTYFKMKNKYDYSFTCEEKAQFQSQVLLSLELSLCNVDTLIVPETSNKCLLEIAYKTGKEVVVLHKNSKDNIIIAISQQTMMKAEKAKLLSSLESMDTIKIANIAGNQRKRFVECLFKPLDNAEILKGKNVALLDDSVFSGYTFLAANHILSGLNQQNLILFSKVD